MTVLYREKKTMNSTVGKSKEKKNETEISRSMEKKKVIALVILIGSVISTAGLAVFLYGFVEWNPSSDGLMTPHYTLAVSGFLALTASYLLAFERLRKSVLALLWTVLAWLSTASCGAVAYTLGVQIANCQQSDDAPIVCRAAVTLSELGDATDTQINLAFAGAILFAVGTLVVAIAVLRNVRYSALCPCTANARHRRHALDDYDELLE
jgi:hypothetical protein